jgi:hypothetical protein
VSTESKADMKTNPEVTTETFEMRFDGSTIKHLGVQMYSSLPPVIGELVSNAWDAGAQNVFITIPTETITDSSAITIEDDGVGMTADEIQGKFLVVGRDRRKEESDAPVVVGTSRRPVMGRKGIGKFSGFGIARTIELESIKNGDTSRFIMAYEDLEAKSKDGKILFPRQAATGTLTAGTRITLKNIQKFKTRKISIPELRRGIARQYAIIGAVHNFRVFINDVEITTEERDIKKYLDKDINGQPIVVEYIDVEIRQNTGWTISGWIGTLAKGITQTHDIKPGVIIMARNKMVQTPFLFNIESSHPTAFSYITGEIRAEFVDTPAEDMVATSRTTLVWDTDANKALEEWGKSELWKIEKIWSRKRGEANQNKVEASPIYQKFLNESLGLESSQLTTAKKLVQEMVKKNPERDPQELDDQIQFIADFARFDAFIEIAQKIEETDSQNIPDLIQLFQRWELVEAKEMLKVTEGRIKTVQKLESHIQTNALEVPTLHRFLKEFPWVIDPRWTLVSDEITYTELLRTQFPSPPNTPDIDKRIDFLCVKEGDSLVVLEIKRPSVKASIKEFNQIEEYVSFMRDHVKITNDPSLRLKRVVGYLLVGGVVDTYNARGKLENLEQAGIYVRLYSDLLGMVKKLHTEFLERYELLKNAKASLS